MMDSRISPGAPGGRYNPFAFPSDTDFRFWLLIATVLGSSLLMYQAIANTLVSGGQSLRELNDLCSARATTAFPGTSFSQRQSWLIVFNDCEKGARGSRAGVPAGVAVLTAGVIALYLAHPAWRRRRGNLVPLTAEDAPEVLEQLVALSGVAGLRSPPAFMWNPLNMARSGVAFGTPGRRVVALTGGLATTLWTDPDVFRAVVLHELAHIRNGDIDKAYLSVAVWWAFVLTALLPFAAMTVRPGGSDLLARSISFVSLGLVVFLLRNATLRAREMFADVRASVWPGYAGALARILPSTAEPQDRRLRSVVASVRNLLQMHPPSEARRAAVRDPGPLFGLESLIAAGVGFAAAVAVVDASAIVSTELAALLFAGLVTAVMGLAVWRETFLADARGVPVRGLARLALALGVGFAVGDALSLSQTIDLPAGFALTGVALLLFDIVWYGLLFAGTVLFLRWLVAAASTWLPVVAGRKSPRLAYLAGIPLAIPVLALGFWFLLSVEPLRMGGGQLPPAAFAEGLSTSGFPVPAGSYIYAAAALGLVIALAATSPVAFAVAQLLWILPLAPWIWRRRMATVSTARWAMLDGGPPSQSGATPPRFRVGMAATAGLLGGAAFCNLSLSVGLLLSASSREALVTWLAYGQLLSGILVQAIVAAAVAYRAKPLGAVHGIFSGFVCGLVMASAALLVTALTLSPAALRVEGLASSILVTFTSVAVVITVPAAALAAALGGRGHRGERPGLS
jgi:Zn-dependent protease with chaperone function